MSCEKQVAADDKKPNAVEQREEFERLLKQLNLEKSNATKEHKFWNTQPVPGVDEVPQDHAPIMTTEAMDSLRNRNEQVNEVYELLTQHYVENDDAIKFRFDYSPDFLKWALMPPGYFKAWHIGVRNAKNNKLMAFISGVPANVRVHEKTLKMAEINFLCVHKKLPTPISFPTPVTKCRYYHRPLNTRKLVEVGFVPLPPRMTITRMTKLQKLPDQTTTPGFRAMAEKDVQQVTTLLNGYLTKFQLVVDVNEQEIAHWMLPRDGVISSFVVESPTTNQITDVLRTACSYYNVATSMPLAQLMQDALIAARDADFDVFNMLGLMDNMELVKELKFIPGNGELHYYLYNWRCPRVKSDELGLVLL
ncbi:TPA: hypothetical protein N0F65_006831 [Lagenidium giganteum]|uniref:Glycylpeptide N-tetradecanoyltransferase n=1 Tax=Lagenidium giganteum TaxID=4803 RepID=A0AAV2ZA60_9STRA|nr:TPA: hypothetical protein N0F65_006831 [Lagenidium giganteum]